MFSENLFLLHLSNLWTLIKADLGTHKLYSKLSFANCSVHVQVHIVEKLQVFVLI